MKGQSGAMTMKPQSGYQIHQIHAKFSRTQRLYRTDKTMARKAAEEEEKGSDPVGMKNVLEEGREEGDADRTLSVEPLGLGENRGCRSIVKR